MKSTLATYLQKLSRQLTADSRPPMDITPQEGDGTKPEVETPYPWGAVLDDEPNEHDPNEMHKDRFWPRRFNFFDYLLGD